MGLLKQEIEEPEFSGTMYTLTCNATELPLLYLLKRKDSTEINRIKAISPFAYIGDSGWQEIEGELSFGPVPKEKSKFPTEIGSIEIDANETKSTGIKSIIIEVLRWGS